MPDELENFMIAQKPTSERPLLGLTVLIVEDSLFASEALRLLCLRSGARIRRADNLNSARRHLSVYRPVVVIVDLGLPDGSGTELIQEIASATHRVSVILGISGDEEGSEQAMAAGADGFLAKPIVNLSVFQSAVLAHLPLSQQPNGLRTICSEKISPDNLALKEDLTNIMYLLKTSGSDRGKICYAAQFIEGLALLTGDEKLAQTAKTLKFDCLNSNDGNVDVAKISEIVQKQF